MFFFAFQSTPSARRATSLVVSLNKALKISIHALREESDACGSVDDSRRNISIHALREESDPPSALLPLPLLPISIHALREESDPLYPGE